MHPRTPTHLRNILATLYSDERSIRRVVDDAEIDSSKMAIDAHALNSWHSVLSEAEKNHQVEALLKAVEVEYGNNQAFHSASHAYRQALSDSTSINLGSKKPVDHPKTQSVPQRQWLSASITALLLISITGIGWYWVHSLYNDGQADKMLATTITKTAPPAPTSDGLNEAVADVKPSIYEMATKAQSPLPDTTGVLTQSQILQTPTLIIANTQKLTETFTITPIPNESVSQALSTPTVLFTLQTTVTVTPALVKVYPCKAEVSSTDTTLVNRIYSTHSSKGAPMNAIAIGTKVQIRGKFGETEIWYHIFDEYGQELGWILSSYLQLSASCPD